MGGFCCDTRQQMIKGATVEPALRSEFFLWCFFFRNFICYNFICPMFFCLPLYCGFIRTYICGHSSANQKCCPVSYFDEHLILFGELTKEEKYRLFRDTSSLNLHSE